MSTRRPVVRRAPVLRSSSRARRFPPLRIALAALAAVGAFGLPRLARADVSSWASVAAGPTWLDEGGENDTGFESVPTLALLTGLGSSPENALVVGGAFQMQTHFSRGTDLGLLARVATQGFVLGDWGAALDLGGYARFWGQHSEGGLGALSLGAPWGITLTANGSLGTHEARSFGVTLGIDFARLTVFRSVGTNWFPNPYPGYDPKR